MLRLLKFIGLFAILASLTGGVYLYTHRRPVDYAAMAQPTLAQIAAASTDDDRFTAILFTQSAFVKIVGSLKNEQDAQLALPTLVQLADEAKRLDNEMRLTPDVRRAILKRREPEVQQSAMVMAFMMISLGTKISQIKVMTTISAPLATLASTLQP